MNEGFGSGALNRGFHLIATGEGASFEAVFARTTLLGFDFFEKDGGTKDEVRLEEDAESIVERGLLSISNYLVQVLFNVDHFRRCIML